MADNASRRRERPSMRREPAGLARFHENGARCARLSDSWEHKEAIGAIQQAKRRRDPKGQGAD